MTRRAISFALAGGLLVSCAATAVAAPGPVAAQIVAEEYFWACRAPALENSQVLIAYSACPETAERVLCESTEAADQVLCDYTTRTSRGSGRRIVGRLFRRVEGAWRLDPSTGRTMPDVIAPIAGAQAAAMPATGEVERALHWDAGSFCRFMIDDCVDAEGNDINPLPEFTVSDLACRPAPDRRATCSFTSVKSFGPGNVRPSERCTGTLVRHDHDNGDIQWLFVVPNPRRSYIALLSCN